MKVILVLLLSLVAGVAEAACPAGSTCQTFNGQYNYSITGGTTARQDVARWRDRGISMPDVGIDCTGTSNSSAAFQAAANTMTSTGNMVLVAPIGCQIRLDTGITFTAAVGPTIVSEARAESNIIGAPAFIWNGTGGTMFTFTTVDHPTIRGFNFKSNAGKTVNRFLNFDGDPQSGPLGGVIGTDARIEQNSFDSSNQNNSSFIAIAVSQTATNNHENYVVQDNDFICSGSTALRRSVAGSTTNASPNLTGATGANFVSGDIGKRIRVSYAGGILDTTISSITSGTAVVMAANATFTQSNTTVHVGEAFGTGYDNGPSANAKHQKIYRNRFGNCAKAISFGNGSFDINFLSGYWNDVALDVQATAEPSYVGFYTTEHDMRFISSGNGTPITVSNSRWVIDNAQADGFIYINGGVRMLLISGNLEGSPLPTNATFFRFNGGATTNIASINNSWINGTYASIGYGAATVLSVFGDTGVDTNFFGTTRFIGMPTSCSGLATGTIRSNAGVMTICP